MGLHVAISSRAPYWDLPWERIILAIAIALAATLFLQWCVFTLKFWALHVLRVLLVSLCLAYAVQAFMMGYFWYSCFALACPFFFYTLSAGLEREMRRSFLDPRQAWFEGRPQVLPRLSCIWAEGQDWSAQVSRMDREGTFIVLPQGRSSGLHGTMAVELLFSYGESQARSRGRVIRTMDQGRGFGVKVEGMNFEETQRWGDFVEQVRGKGYV